MLNGLRKGSFPIASVGDTRVRIHFAFVLWIAYFMLTRDDKLGEAILQVALFGSVLLHELGHVWGARRVGLRAEEVILWPLGGVAPMEKARSARGELISTGAGPLVNLLLVLLGVAALAVYSRDVSLALQIVSPWHPLGPAVEAPAQTILRYVIGANLLLFTFNVIPAFPLDGGGIFRSALWAMKASWRTATLIAGAVAMACGLGMVALAPFVGDMSLTLFLAIVGLFVIVTSFGEFQRARTFVVLPRLDDDLMPFERNPGA